MSDGTFCRICHRLMVPNREQICGECQDAMRQAGYAKVVMCRDCKYAHLTDDGECKYCDMEADDEGNIPERYRPWDWYCADGERKETK